MSTKETRRASVMREAVESLDFVRHWVDRNVKPAGDRNILWTRLGILRANTTDDLTEPGSIARASVTREAVESLDLVTRWVDRNAKPSGDRRILLNRLGILRAAWTD